MHEHGFGDVAFVLFVATLVLVVVAGSIALGLSAVVLMGGLS